MFSEKRAIVTGGTSGIGRAIALALAESQADVIATGATADEVAVFTNEEQSRNISAEVLDVTDNHAVDEFVGRFDSLDILVNAAGIIMRNGAEFKPENFQRVIDVNLAGTMRMSVACHSRLGRKEDPSSTSHRC